MKQHLGAALGLFTFVLHAQAMPLKAAAVAERMATDYRAGRWDEFFGKALYHRAHAPLSAKAIALEITALAKHCQWEMASAVASEAQSNLAATKSIRLIEDAVIHAQLAQYAPETTATQTPASRPGAQLWPVKHRVAALLADPLRLRVKVQNRCSLQARSKITAAASSVEFDYARALLRVKETGDAPSYQALGVALLNPSLASTKLHTLIALAPQPTDVDPAVRIAHATQVLRKEAAQSPVRVPLLLLRAEYLYDESNFDAAARDYEELMKKEATPSAVLSYAILKRGWIELNQDQPLRAAQRWAAWLGAADTQAPLRSLLERDFGRALGEAISIEKTTLLPMIAAGGFNIQTVAEGIMKGQARKQYVGVGHIIKIAHTAKPDLASAIVSALGRSCDALKNAAICLTTAEAMIDAGLLPHALELVGTLQGLAAARIRAKVAVIDGSLVKLSVAAREYLDAYLSESNRGMQRRDDAAAILSLLELDEDYDTILTKQDSLCLMPGPCASGANTRALFSLKRASDGVRKACDGVRSSKIAQLPRLVSALVRQVEALRRTLAKVTITSIAAQMKSHEIARHAIAKAIEALRLAAGRQINEGDKRDLAALADAYLNAERPLEAEL